MSKSTKQNRKPPTFLSDVGKNKWKDLLKQLDGKPFDYDALAMLCKSWEVYLESMNDIAVNGILYRDTLNGRTWNNPAINTADLFHKQIIKLSKQLGLMDGKKDVTNPFAALVADLDDTDESEPDTELNSIESK